MGAGMDMAPPAATRGGGLKWPPPAITARAGCITAAGELEHQRLYLPSLMGRTGYEVSRSVEKYPVWDWSEGAAATQERVDSHQCGDSEHLHFISVWL